MNSATRDIIIGGITGAISTGITVGERSVGMGYNP
jgi:hypothetical protein